MRIDIAVYDGFDELDAVGPLEVLRSAAASGADLAVRLVSLTGAPVTGAFGLRLEVDAAYAEPPGILVMTGGGWNARADRGAWGEAQRGEWLDHIRAAHEAGSVLAGVCSGTMLIAHAGVIGSRRATTHHGAHADLAATGATVLTDRVVDGDDLVTSGGVTSGIDLALWLVERYCGRALADTCAERMEYPRARPAQ